MDSWAKGFWTLFLIFILGMLAVAFVIAVVTGKAVAKRLINKTSKHSRLKRNLLIAVCFYCVSELFILLRLGPWWGKQLGLFGLPVATAVIFIFLEFIEMLRELYRRMTKGKSGH
jgi:Mn2+/Fe2+ NRAMP family transporter